MNSYSALKTVALFFLSGTPIINYPNEIGILFNILRGYIKTWTLPLNIKTSEKVDEAKIKKLLNSPSVRGLVDYVDITIYKTVEDYTQSFWIRWRYERTQLQRCSP